MLYPLYLSCSYEVCKANVCWHCDCNVPKLPHFFSPKFIPCKLRNVRNRVKIQLCVDFFFIQKNGLTFAVHKYCMYFWRRLLQSADCSADSIDPDPQSKTRIVFGTLLPNGPYQLQCALQTIMEVTFIFFTHRTSPAAVGFGIMHRYCCLLQYSADSTSQPAVANRSFFLASSLLMVKTAREVYINP